MYSTNLLKEKKTGASRVLLCYSRGSRCDFLLLVTLSTLPQGLMIAFIGRFHVSCQLRTMPLNERCHFFMTMVVVKYPNLQTEIRLPADNLTGQHGFLLPLI